MEGEGGRWEVYPGKVSCVNDYCSCFSYLIFSSLKKLFISEQQLPKANFYSTFHRDKGSCSEQHSGVGAQLETSLVLQVQTQVKGLNVVLRWVQLHVHNTHTSHHREPRAQVQLSDLSSNIELPSPGSKSIRGKHTVSLSISLPVVDLVRSSSNSNVSFLRNHERTSSEFLNS